MSYNYKLIDGSLNDVENIQKTILLNRGVENWERYLNLKSDCIHDYSLLKNLDKAIDLMKNYLDVYNQGKHIHIIVDCDVDGYGSGSMIYRYLKKIGFKNITYSLHTKKQHGITDDIVIPENCDLLIIPDAGSNDIEQCKNLKEKGVDIIILDHHQCDKENSYAIVVNNQMCDYPNKNFCGAGIVYKFLKALDDELWTDYADEMLDINALCNISDVMDMRELETRYYVNLGLNKIRSKLFKALIEEQSYSMKDVVNITSVQFYITPILNAMIRVGNQDDKDLLFRAFIETDEVFKYKKRGETEEVDEDIYKRAARLCNNAKGRQSKEVQKGVINIEECVEKQGLDRNKVMFINVSDILADTLTGLAAIKIAEKYNKPCVLLRRKTPREDGLFYGGSCRNFDYSPIHDLKNFLEGTGQFEFVQGHPNAAGVSINRNNVKKAIEICDEELRNIDFTKTYQCDFDINCENLDISFVKEIDDLKWMFGQGIKEPLIHISNIPVSGADITIMGKNSNSWKIIVNDDIAFVKFLVDKDNDEIINNYSKNQELTGTMNVISTASLNNYKGILTPQIIVKEYEFIKGR